MTKNTSTTSIKPTPGYLLATPYVGSGPWSSVKESAGEDVKSEVVAVGPSVIDSEGIERRAPCNVGDVVISTDSNKTFEDNFTKYRFIHFTEVHGIYEPKR